MDLTRVATRGLALGLFACLACADGEARVAQRDATSAGSSTEVQTLSLDVERLMADVAYLSSDERRGRATGTPGATEARAFIAEEFQKLGLQPVAGSYFASFDIESDSVVGEGVNVLGTLEGMAHPGRYLVVTAHYDHLGEHDGEVFNGADDNASGVATLLAIARDLQENPPQHSVIFVAFDAEERGLLGAQAFVSDPPWPLEAMALNVNLDMVSRSSGVLFASGTRYTPSLVPLIERAARGSQTELRFGHDGPGGGSDDWTGASDHGPFHAAGVPFVYFGVEDHADYHRPTDDVESIVVEDFASAARVILAAVRELDQRASDWDRERP